MSDYKNITRIKIVHGALKELQDLVVFIGGATVSFYKDRPASETRPTDDVDIIIEITSYAEFSIIEEKLRQKGFTNDVTSNIIYRYKVKGIIVYIMPTNENILGFSNQWYPDGFKYAIDYQIDENTKVKIFDPTYFIASKIVAFKNRGKNDGRTSSDFEDIVYILNNRNSIWQEFRTTPKTLKSFLIKEFKNLVKNKYIHEWISAHLEYHEQNRLKFIITEISNFTLGKCLVEIL